MREMKHTGRLLITRKSRLSGLLRITTPRDLSIKETIDEPVKAIYATSLRTGDVLPDWRKASISPIRKKGSATNPLYVLLACLINQHSIDPLTAN